jgi:hypothetical protein
MLGLGVLIYMSPSWVAGDPRAPAVTQVVRAVLWSLYIWSWLHVVLYLGLRWLNFPSRFQRYAQESVLPVYVISHPILLVIASFVVTWNLGLWPKFLVILVAVAGFTLVIYEFGVRRWPLTRLVFGLFPLPVAPPKPHQTVHLPSPTG